MKLFVGQFNSHYVALVVMISKIVREDPSREFFLQECAVTTP